MYKDLDRIIEELNNRLIARVTVKVDGSVIFRANFDSAPVSLMVTVPTENFKVYSTEKILAFIERRFRQDLLSLFFV